MPIYHGLTQVNEKDIILNGQQMGMVYIGDKLVWEKTSIFPVHYGLLYNHYAVNSPKEICAPGFHVPSSDELFTLQASIGGGSLGYKLMEVGTIYWNDPNSLANNQFLFNARGTGNRSGNPTLFNQDKSFFWMWASNGSGNYGYCVSLSQETSNFNVIAYSAYGKYNGMSCRLLKNDSNDPGQYIGNDGKIYPTVKIGNQVWLAANLAETKYQDGSIIPEITDSIAWFNSISDAMCVFGNNWNNL